MTKIRSDPTRTVVLSVALVVGVLGMWGSGVTGEATVAKETPEAVIQVSIKTMSFHVTGYGREGNPTSIVVRNEDGVTHGFYSPLFKEVPVRLEGDGYQIVGEHGPSFRVDPGKTMALHFTKKGAATGPVTGINVLMRHVIWCDMHPDVKGEVFIIKTGAR